MKISFSPLTYFELQLHFSFYLHFLGNRHKNRDSLFLSIFFRIFGNVTIKKKLTLYAIYTFHILFIYIYISLSIKQITIILYFILIFFSTGRCRAQKKCFFFAFLSFIFFFCVACMCVRAYVCVCMRLCFIDFFVKCIKQQKIRTHAHKHV